jgi:hypothetical protein
MRIPPRFNGGAYRGRHDTWSGDAVDVAALSDERRDAYGEVVWSWRPKGWR